jgi:hypothetical protein
MPINIFTGQTPVNPDVDNVEGAAGVTLGTVWRSDKEGVLRGVRFYLGSRNSDTDTVIGALYNWGTGELLVQQSYTITGDDPIGFVTIPFAEADQPLIKQNQRYIAAVFYPCDTSNDGKAHYAYTSSFLATEIANPPLYALKDESILNRRNGLYNYGATLGFPTSGSAGTCYFIDVEFDYIARMPVLNETNGTYEPKVIKYRQNGEWRY